MASEDVILDAYHRAIGRFQKRTGVSYPLTRVNCVHDDGTITDTNVLEPVMVARWNEDTNGRVRIGLA